ncbi:MAG: DUF3060 domain-containing protein [Armatimonadota bacterium]
MNIVKISSPLLAALANGLAMIVSAPLEAQTRAPRQSNIVVNSRQGINQSYAVNGRTVSVRGSNNRIRLTGYSSFVRVTGTNNVVSVDAARAIAVSGRNNRVTWRRRANGISPRISRTGTGNQVSRSK